MDLSWIKDDKLCAECFRVLYSITETHVVTGHPGKLPWPVIKKLLDDSIESYREEHDG